MEETVKVSRPRNEILGVKVDVLALEETLQKIEEWAREKQVNPAIPGKRIITANPEYIILAGKDEKFREVINSADLVTPDGVGLILAGKILGKPFRGRVTGVGLAYALAKRSSETGLRLFLLGAGPGVAEKAALAFKRLYPGTLVVGTFAGEANENGDRETLAHIKKTQADIILVAYGMVKQDYWAVRNIDESGAGIAIGVGGVLDYISGKIPLAPPWIRKIGLEWTYRLLKEPRRWRRMLALPNFAWKVFRQATREKFKKG